MLSLKGCIVTVDALNCQRETARKIVDQGGDYALALKGNQGTLHADVSRFLDDPATAITADHRTVDGDHGRIETRRSTVATDIGWLQEDPQWPGLQAIGKVTRSSEASTKTTVETAYYLLSKPLSPERFGEVVRAHWAVENSLHWVLDVIMNEDQPETASITARKTSQSCGTWRSISSPRKNPKNQSDENSIARGGTTHSSPKSSLSFDMRLPWDTGESGLCKQEKWHIHVTSNAEDRICLSSMKLSSSASASI
jgi:predicted transposase YbfD/YdcC